MKVVGEGSALSKTKYVSHHEDKLALVFFLVKFIKSRDGQGVTVFHKTYSHGDEVDHDIGRFRARN